MLPKLKSYLRNTAPVALYRLASVIYHIPYNLVRTLEFSRGNILTEQTYTTVTYEDEKFEILLNPANGLVDMSIFRQKEWEPKITKKISETLRPGEVFVDVGANIGFFTLLAASKVGSAGKVIAIEPIPHLAAQIQASINANSFKNVTVLNVGCADRSGEAVLGLYGDNIGKSSILDSEEKDLVKINIKIDTLDTLLNEEEKISFIKVDVEGYEPQVLAGAINTIKKHKPTVLFEFSPRRMHEAKQSEDLIYLVFKKLKALGYKIETIKGDQIHDIHDFTNRKRKIGSYIEIVCTPSS